MASRPQTSSLGFPGSASRPSSARTPTSRTPPRSQGRSSHARGRAPITTTLALAAVVREALAALPARLREVAGDDPVRRTFQALRIEVNDELGALRAFLAALPSCVAPGGRVAILTFHSGEDRLVKKSLQAGARDGIWAAWSREPIRPGPEELRANPRSRPAKLRTALRAGAAAGRTA